MTSQISFSSSPRNSVRFASVAAIAALVACGSTAAGDAHVPHRPSGTQQSTNVETSSAMVASNSELASAAGIEVLKAGGNAVDAAVAVGFALAVTHPEAGNIGGGGFMLVRMADGRTAALDYREVAPKRATRDMFVNASGQRVASSTIGPLAVGVPGSVAGLCAALDRFGTLPRSTVMAPAIRLARDGFVVDTALARSLRDEASLISRFSGADLFLPQGKPLAVGSRLVQPALARTLERIAADGAKGFYTGAVAGQIEAEMQRRGGLITREDLAAYTPAWRTPLRGTYRGDTLLTMPPPSSGGVTLLETLNVLETWRTLPPARSAAGAHVLTEALRRAFVDRNTKLGDPAFVHVPVDSLTSKAYARQLAATIDPSHASRTSTLAGAAAEGVNTTHYSVVDAAGNAVATTTTLNDLYGSGVYVADGGFFLNDEMDDFTARPGVPNGFGLIQGEQNAIAPGKRMLSAMAPTIVVDGHGHLRLVLGSRGGPRIITSVAQVLIGVIDEHLPIREAVDAPRIHHQAWPDTVWYEAGALSPATQRELTTMGYTLVVSPFEPGGYIGRVIAIERRDGKNYGAVDRRTSGGIAQERGETGR